MLAVKHFDPVMGVDIHIVTIPPVGPVPIPHPHISMVLDPMDYVPIMGATVLVGGVPRGTAGTAGKPVPHIPMGGPFVKPPGNEDEIFMGSATVLAEDTPFTFTALPVLSCQDIGMPAPFRTKKPRKSYGMVLPTSVVISVPAGMPVLIGGPPTIDMMGMAMAAGMAALGKAAKKLRGVMKKSKKMKKISKAIHKKAKKAMDKLGLPPNARNKVHKSICTVTGHPVDVATGKMFTDHIDFELPGPIPLVWERTWYSTSTYEGPLGHGWHHNYDMALSEIDGAVAVRLADGRPCVFPALKPGEQSFDRAERLTLICDEYGYALDDTRGLRYRFTPHKGDIGNQLLREIIDKPLRSKIRFAYSSSGVMSSIKDSAGRIIRLESDEHGRIVKIYLPCPLRDSDKENFCAVKYLFKEGNLCASSDALEQQIKYSYDARLMIRETNRNGLSFYFEYDQKNSQAKCTRTWGDGGIYDHSLIYDGGRTKVRNSLGDITQYSHNGVLPTEIVDPLGGVSTYEYNEYSQKTRYLDELKREERFDYDDRGNLTSVNLKNSGEITVSYDDADRPIEAIDAMGGVWKWQYDDFGLLLCRQNPLGEEKHFSYDGPRLTKLSNNKGLIARFYYDENSNVRCIENADGSRYLKLWDKLGNLIATTDENNNTTAIEYDLLGRAIHINDADGTRKTIGYDPEGNVVDLRGPKEDLSISYQGLNQIRRHVRNGVIVDFEYDCEEQLRTITKQDGSSFKFMLDSCGRLINEIDFSGRKKHYQRDEAGQIIQIDRPNQQLSRLRYDNLGNVTKIEHSDGSFDFFEFRSDGLMVKAANQFSELSFKRDVLGKIVKEECNGHWISYEYDLVGAVSRIDSSLSANFTVSRDKRGNVSGLTDDHGNSLSIERDKLGLEICRSFSSGLEQKWQRDRLGRPQSQTDFFCGQECSTTKYKWTDDGHLKALVQAFGAREFSYDNGGRLTSETNVKGEAKLRIFDSLGNLFTDPQCKDRSYGASGEILWAKTKKGIIKYQYDAEGNLASKVDEAGGLWTYSWNLSGHLIKVCRPDKKEVLFGYDSLGRRISKTFQNKVTRWLWNQDTPLHEWVEYLEPRLERKSSTGQFSTTIAVKHDGPLNSRAPPEAASLETPITWIFEPGTFTLLAKRTGDAFYSVTSDHLGSPNALFDSEGNCVWSSHLDIYGNRVGGEGRRSDCPFRWPGQYEDEETGLHYNRFRYYDPEAAQYISLDPIGLAGGINPYAYVEDPLTWIDPFGLAKCHASGQRGVDAAKADLKKAGFTVEAEEVTMRVNGSRVRADLVATKNGKTYVVEVKNGKSKLTKNQDAAGVYDMDNPANDAAGSIDTSKGTSGSFEVATDNRPAVGDRGDVESATFMTMVYDV